MKAIYNLLIGYRIFIRKNILNFLILFTSPRKKFMIYLSQNLDKYIVLRQKMISDKYFQEDKKTSCKKTSCKKTLIA
ncbi:conserved hypothetical protein [Clostridium neonatale]|uniref:hypothetical protein n=1 Tax=Clostridium neonatale TaxID=137838 RepID=UPI00291C23A7|nr:conserved hypothetical protein [Clostridium neonatale]